ncbi:B12-binding domain-containing radical SAM protein, partial [Candidatus Woesebacteria bacterium CG_4_10_14_0_2_um_filter_39_14]
MKILLVYPQYPVTFWSFKYIMNLVGKKASFPPLGLLTVASLLPAKWGKKLVDMNVDELKDEDI